ncbi:sugar kinase [Paenibacillus sp. 7124]|uniref:Sugar kinase n=1 Tax=Paenibacillus apii TaxID=1850370 RepID=A0A6M1PR79_9BACL|nr:sugar kinase [Paenibacillus apii]NGM85028.1 sugar kinase [Paenibacillus apii]NJJ38512.1 sugar kinase [Paenibacillus apii]
MSLKDVVTFGEAMVMFVADKPGALKDIDKFSRRLAGAEVNTAVGFARLGLSAGWVSRLGDDVFGEYIREYLERENIDISGVTSDSRHPTAFQLKSKVLEGDPQVQYFRKNSAASTLSGADVDPDYLTGFRHLHMTGIPPALTKETREFAYAALGAMKAEGRSISFDPNLRPSLWSSREEMVSVINDLACRADWVLPGVEEGEILTGSRDPRAIAEFYLSKGVSLVVVKLGPEGAYFRTKTDEGTVQGFKVEKVVDTVGAGDGFAVGLVSGMLEGLTVSQAVQRGNAIGALAVQSEGDHDGYPTKPELETYLQYQLTGVK